MGVVTVLDFTSGKVHIHHYREVEDDLISVVLSEEEGEQIFEDLDSFISERYGHNDTQWMSANRLILEIH